MPVIEIDGKRVGGGQPGPLTRRLRGLYLEMAAAG
jgi:D-alanine transaminase